METADNRVAFFRYALTGGDGQVVDLALMLHACSRRDRKH